MNRFLVNKTLGIFLLFLISLWAEPCAVHAVPSNTIDRINFGDATSESLHNVQTDGGTSGTGALSQTYRRPADGQSLTFTMAEETFITYRDAKNPNSASNRFNLNAQLLASDPDGVIRSPQALRSAYLNTQYNLRPSNGASAGNGAPGGALNYLRDLAAYEATIRSLIDVDPCTLTPLPGEPGQPDFAWADVQAGAVALRVDMAAGQTAIFWLVADETGSGQQCAP